MNTNETKPIELIEALPVQRDKEGKWHHPGVPMFDEGQNKEYVEWVKSQRLTVIPVKLEDEALDHPAYVDYFEKGVSSFLAWEPKPPSTAPWFTLAVDDTEDGPTWWWAVRGGY